jgi:hypothetical protein
MSEVVANATSDPASDQSPRRRWWERYSSTSPITLTMLALVLGVVIGAVIIMVTSAPVLDAWRRSFHDVGSIGSTLKITFDNVGAAYRAMLTGSIIDPNPCCSIRSAPATGGASP